MTGVFPSLSAFGGVTGLIEKRLRLEAGQDLPLSELNKGHARMVDTFIYNYPTLVRDNPEPFARATNPVRVAIIGSGFAGATAAYELKRAGIKDIVIYEGREVGGQTRLGGRAYSQKMQFNGKEYVNELGAMRVPENSKLFWHYMSKLQGPKAVQKIFPNPGIVATELIYRGLRYLWKEGYPQPENPGNPRQVDWKKLKDDLGEFIGSLRYNSDDVGTIATLLKKPGLSPVELQRIHDYWAYFLKRYDRVSFVGALEEYFGDRWGATEYNMFATLGLGTGGFGPLFPVCFLEILRLFLWEYSNEYSPSLPVQHIAELLLALGSDGRPGAVDIRRETVCYIGLSKRSPDLVDVYSIVPGPNNDIKREYFNYVIVATPLRSMQITMNLDAEETPVIYRADSNAVFRGEANNMVRESMRIPHIMDSSKLFGLLPEKPWFKSGWPMVNGEPVKCVLTDTLARQMYFLDPYPEDRYAATNVLISYNWGDDSVKIMGIRNYTPNQRMPRGANPDLVLKEAYQNALETTIANSPVAASLDVLNMTNQYTHLASVVWQQEPMIFGAFKIDFPKQYYYTSQLVYQYQYAASGHPEHSKRVFLAGNNVSFQGGWIEGAMQSAVNAASAVLYHMAVTGQAVNFRMKELFAPNPFQQVITDLKREYELPPVAADLVEAAE